EARVRVDVVRAEEPLRQLVDRVVVLRQELARDVEGDRLGAVLRDDRAQSPSEPREDLAPPELPEARVAAGAHHRAQRAVTGVNRGGELERLRAGAATVHGVARVALDGAEPAAL